MDGKGFLKILTKRKSDYLEKTKNFNKLPTILFCKHEELSEFENLQKKTDIKFDKLYIGLNPVDLIRIIKKNGNSNNFFISNGLISDDLYEELKLKKYCKANNLYIGPTKYSYVDLYDRRFNINQNANNIAAAINLLKDKKSRNVLLNILTRLCLQYQFHYHYETEDFPQYFNTRFKFNNNEVYLDAGVCDGENVKQFVGIVNGNYKYIYGIEADKRNYNTCIDNLKEITNIKLLNCGLYDRCSEVSFVSTEKSGKVGNAHIAPNGDTIVKTITGDSLPIKPTFIKMDIEGAEKEALLGLQKTIRLYKPKLAICIYHWQSDFWEIPLLINRINPNYKIEIRNHVKLHCLIETVCYAY